MKFDTQRAIYIGYQKILGMSDSKSLSGNDRKVAAGFKVPVMGIDATYENQRHKLAVDAASISSANGAAPDLIWQLDRRARDISGSAPVEHGQWYRFTGESAWALRSHDDFRLQEEAEATPRIAIWASTLTNPDGTVTLLMLHGTADGNVSETTNGKVPLLRSGSGTESLFEQLWAESHNAERVDPFSNYSEFSKKADPADIAERCVWMLGQYNEFRRINIETLFRISYDGKIPEGRRQISPLARRETSSRPPVVSRILIGSPVLVQYPETTPTEFGEKNFFAKAVSSLINWWRDTRREIARLTR